METNLWVEKYRPKSISDLVLSNEDHKVLKTSIENKDMVNFLFYGPPGTGKTTTARILISTMLQDADNALILNGSEERGIDVLRVKLTRFLTTAPFGDDKFKIIFIDESDYLTANFFAGLRNFIEKYSHIARFIFTCNYIYKIPTPIQSRFQSFEMKPLDDSFIQNYCVNILTKENVTYNDDDLMKVIRIHKPDIRSIIQILQKYTVDNKLLLPSIDKLISKEKKLVEAVGELLKLFSEKNPSFSVYIERIQTLALDTTIDFSQVFLNLFDQSEIPVYTKVLINKYANGLNNCISPAMHFMAFVYESMKMIKEISNS